MLEIVPFSYTSCRSSETGARFTFQWNFSSLHPPSSLAMDASPHGPFRAPHILLVSLPAPGHLFPFTNFAYQLAAAGAQVTCLTSGYVFEHLQHRGDHKYVKQSSGSSSTGRVRFEGLLESKEVREVTIVNVLAEWGQALSDEEMGAALERRFLELQPPPCCIVSDMFQGWVQDVADKLHVPRHTLFTMPAKDLAFVLRVRQRYSPESSLTRLHIVEMPCFSFRTYWYQTRGDFNTLGFFLVTVRFLNCYAVW